MKYDVFVSRHKDLRDFLIYKGELSEDVPWIEHADNINDIRGKRIIGVCPPKLAIMALNCTELELHIPKEIKGRDLTLSELELYSGPLATYEVREIETRQDFSESILNSNAATFIQYVTRSGLIKKGSEQHKTAVKRNSPMTKEEIENKSILGSLPYYLAQYAKDISQFRLYYTYEHRGLVHDYDLMHHFNQGLFTYTVKRIA